MKAATSAAHNGIDSNSHKLLTEFKQQEVEKLKEIQSLDKSIDCKYPVVAAQKTNQYPRYSNPSGIVDITYILADLLNLEYSYVNSKLNRNKETTLSGIVSKILSQNLQIVFPGVLDLYPIVHKGGKEAKDLSSSKRTGKPVTVITKDRMTVKAVIKKSLRVNTTTFSKDLKTTDIF